jgi:aminoglycoside 6'-N-acetyltransferase I
MIRPVTPNDATAWRALRLARWPAITASDHARQLVHFFWSGSRDIACFVAEENGGVVGFIELLVREEVTFGGRAPVAHVEGWYVMPEWQGRGIGRALLATGEAWGRDRRCEALTAQTPLESISDHAMHTALGFAPVAELVQWRRTLREGEAEARDEAVQLTEREMEPAKGVEPTPEPRVPGEARLGAWPFARIVMRAMR